MFSSDENFPQLISDVIDEGKNVGSLNLAGVNALPSNKQVAIIFYQGTCPTCFVAFNDLVEGNIHDSIVVSPIENDANKFSSKLPQWNNKVLYNSGSLELSRCFSTSPSVPDYWFSGRTGTFLAPNDCPAEDPNAGGDPHFLQKVFDGKTKQLTNICYDVFAESNELISILHDNLTNSDVQGVLKDDYYMHQIIIRYKGGLIVVDSSFIMLNNHKLEWAVSKYNFDNLVIAVSKREVSIQTSYKNFKLTTIVRREFKQHTGSFLNVFFEGMDAFSGRYNGLIGDIGKRKYIINDGIQSNGKSVWLDGDTIIEGRVTKRFSSECILLPVNQLLHPKKLSDYVY
ncbi:DgyrCDS1982 [Dimorphilus gyrociliatus]|uniref:DgyrCDS1982 n=1 Tax=Dimorphilus gyrociliatus TaxID=2664684 RepID=A0A7I8VDZ9_9ANNE|nr:DgyrCDS1982 [Dimorphilus gyrociliatus]